MTAGENDPRRVGLCFGCLHARTVTTRTSTFWMCGLSKTDPRFDKYPRLPVIACEGYQPKSEDEDSGNGH